MTHLRLAASILITSCAFVAACTDDERIRDPETNSAGGSGGTATGSGGSGGSGTGGASGGAAGTTSTGGTAGSAGGSAGTAGSSGSGSGGSSGSGSGGNAGSGGTSGAAGSAGAGGGSGDAGAFMFPAGLYDHVWLFGFSGGLDHFDWVKFTPSAPGASTGTWAVLPLECDAGCTSGPIDCRGTDGLFSASPNGEIVLQLPQSADCQKDGSVTSLTWTFGATSASWMPSADLFVTVHTGVTTTTEAHRLPVTACDGAFTTCAWPT